MAIKLLSGECILQEGTNRRAIRGKTPYYVISTMDSSTAEVYEAIRPGADFNGFAPGLPMFPASNRIADRGLSSIS